MWQSHRRDEQGGDVSYMYVCMYICVKSKLEEMCDCMWNGWGVETKGDNCTLV